ncbi:MAG: hypothetical protein IJW92_03955, partial [Clostridia bacterium]|nr:hypothetical protein [Clostridia bacterium]
METIVKPTHDVVVVGGGIAGVSAAVATVLFVRAGMMIDAYQKLLQVGEFRKEQKAQKELADRVGTVYWCVVLAVY